MKIYWCRLIAILIAMAWVSVALSFLADNSSGSPERVLELWKYILRGALLSGLMLVVVGIFYFFFGRE